MFNGHLVYLYKRAVKFSFRNFSRVKPLISPASFILMFKACDRLGDLKFTLRFALLLGFLGFLRISNVAPPTRKAFNHTRHTTIKDVFIKKRKVVVKLKWSKSLQVGPHKFVVLPQLTGHALDPVKALQHLFAHAHTLKSSAPLLQHANGTPITAAFIQKCLKTLGKSVSKKLSKVSFHDFRRSACTLANNLGASEHQLKTHGTWTSNCMYTYILPSANRPSPLQKVFKKVFPN